MHVVFCGWFDSSENTNCGEGKIGRSGSNRRNNILGKKYQVIYNKEFIGMLCKYYIDIWRNIVLIWTKEVVGQAETQLEF